MQIKEGYLLREVAGTAMVVPLNDSQTFHGMVKLNQTGKFLWELLQKPTTKQELLHALCQEYDIDSATAEADLDAFLARLTELDVLNA